MVRRQGNGGGMKILGFTISRQEKDLSPVTSRGGWFPLIRESFAGAWQQNVTINYDTVLTHHAVFACQTLIASDIAKLRVKLVAQDSDGIWSETKNSAYSPVLRKPNDYQNRIQFFESWVLSKLQKGNAYILKQRDNRNVVVKLYVLDPCKVTPLVADDGSIFYELQTDYLSELSENRVVVPAREIIHDRFNCFFHPLVGLSPITANGLAAVQGLAIQTNSTRLFQNGARPSGILTAPGDIKQETATELKAYWESNFSGVNVAKVAVLGDGLKYESMSQNAVDSQVIDQLKWTAEVICSTYHVPPYKIGIGATPTYNNVQALNLEYYSQCLQVLLEAIELCLDEGLGIGEGVQTNGQTYGVEFDTDNLLRMDTVTQFEVLAKAKGTLTLNEARRRADKGPVEGGDTIYLQIQDHSLAAIAARDAQLVDQANNPVTPEIVEPEPPSEEIAEEKAAAAAHFLKKELNLISRDALAA
jgi:HK97 family phage portal protein